MENFFKVSSKPEECYYRLGILASQTGTPKELTEKISNLTLFGKGYYLKDKLSKILVLALRDHNDREMLRNREGEITKIPEYCTGCKFTKTCYQTETL